jgi:hypothetical protein
MQGQRNAMPTKRYTRWRKVIVKRQRKLRKAIDELDDDLHGVAIGGPPKEGK